MLSRSFSARKQPVQKSVRSEFTVAANSTRMLTRFVWGHMVTMGMACIDSGHIVVRILMQLLAMYFVALGKIT